MRLDDPAPTLNLFVGLGQEPTALTKNRFRPQTGATAIHPRNVLRGTKQRTTPTSVSSTTQHSSASSALDEHASEKRCRVNKLLNEIGCARDQVEQRVVLDRVVLVVVKRIDPVRKRSERLTERALIVNLPRFRVRFQIKQVLDAVICCCVNDRKHRAEWPVN